MAKDEDKPVFDAETGQLFGKLFAGLADETARLNNMVYDYEKGRADRCEKALEIALELAGEIIPEVPRSSEGGILMTRLYNLIVTALYHKDVDLETFRERGRWE